MRDEDKPKDQLVDELRELRKAEEKYRILFEQSGDAVYIVSAADRFLNVNQSGLDLFGYTAEEMKGINVRQLYADPEERPALVAKAEQEGGLTEHEIKLKRKDGSEMDCLITAAFLKDECGSTVGYQVVARDISERKRAESEARYQREYFKSLFASSPEAVASIDLERRVMDANLAFERLFGYPLEDIKGKDIQDFILPGDRTKEGRAISQRVAQGELVAMETVRKTADGREIPISLLGAPVVVEGKQIGILAMYSDISERKRVEEELSKSRDELRRLTGHLEKLREEERAHVAWQLHDEVSQALVALQMNLHHLREKLPGHYTGLRQELDSMGRVIGGNIQRLRQIYTDLLPVMLYDLGLAATVEWYAEEFRQHEGIECELSLRTTGVIPWDRALSMALFRVLQEALHNVASHARATKVNISLREAGGGLTLEVADNGRGIGKEEISAPKTLGLIEMRERLRPWGGQVNFSGARGKGTTVTASVPLGEAGSA